MTILHDEHKPKATPMTSDAVRELIRNAAADANPEAPFWTFSSGRTADAILSALSDAGLAVREDWKPIDTAPRDGSPILGWAEDEDDGWQPMVVHWVNAQRDPNSKYVEHDAGWAGRILFSGRSDDEDPAPPTFTITHWMPPPAFHPAQLEKTDDVVTENPVLADSSRVGSAPDTRSVGALRGNKDE